MLFEKLLSSYWRHYFAMFVLRYEIVLISLILVGVFNTLESTDLQNEDKLKGLYDSLKNPNVKFCKDKTRLLPECTACIPGLQQTAGSETCDSYVKESVDIRSEIGKLTSQRYGADVLTSSRPFGLYPCEFLISIHCWLTPFWQKKCFHPNLTKIFMCRYSREIIIHFKFSIKILMCWDQSTRITCQQFTLCTFQDNHSDAYYLNFSC